MRLEHKACPTMCLCSMMNRKNEQGDREEVLIEKNCRGLKVG